MEVVHPCCCGVDVHKASVVACLLTPGAGGGTTKEVGALPWHHDPGPVAVGLAGGGQLSGGGHGVDREFLEAPV